uniref:Variant surface antigen n=1 Tax=Plasmodium chabaudi chabaudi TaxID=31271 RepID=G4XTX9_PLACU|nr:variant surface antigen [Plasmodium chabaudi chabaudi]AEP32846.1 variant surface antigen [Plasmodium chabaudi chabaudi]
MSEELCGAIKFVDENVVFDKNTQNYTFKDEIFKAFCSLSGKDGKGKCDTNREFLNSGIMGLLEYVKSIDEEELDGDKLAQYAILWFNYKISQDQNIEIIRGTMYEILKQNDWFGEHSESIEKIKDMMGIHSEYLKRLYRLLKGICETINTCNGSSDTNKCIESAKKCVDSYHSCIIQFPWKEICNPYCRVLSNLKKDYDKFREANNNKDQLPTFTIPEGARSCEETCAKKWQEPEAKEPAIDVSEIGTPPGISLPGLPVTPTSINNGNKLPYIAVPLILIPIILGISYKYLTPVWRKKSKRKAMKKIINLSDQKRA